MEFSKPTMPPPIAEGEIFIRPVDEMDDGISSTSASTSSSSAARKEQSATQTSSSSSTTTANKGKGKKPSSTGGATTGSSSGIKKPTRDRQHVIAKMLKLHIMRNQLKFLPDNKSRVRDGVVGFLYGHVIVQIQNFLNVLQMASSFRGKKSVTAERVLEAIELCSSNTGSENFSLVSRGSLITIGFSPLTTNFHIQKQFGLV